MTNLEAFTLGALLVIIVWLVTSIIQERGQWKHIKVLILRVANFLGKTAYEIKTAWRNSK